MDTDGPASQELCPASCPPGKPQTESLLEQRNPKPVGGKVNKKAIRANSYEKKLYISFDFNIECSCMDVS